MSQAGILNLDNLVIQTALGSASPIDNTLIFGGNIIISAGGNVVNFNALPNATFSWQNIFSSQNLNTNSGYITNGNVNLNLNLPASSSVGDEIEITAASNATFTITMSGTQQIRLGSRITSLGGKVVSQDIGDSIRIVCISPNTQWQALSENLANYNVS